MIVSRTPQKISFVGGGIDLPEFYEEHGGAVVSTTVDKCEPLEDGDRRQRRPIYKSPLQLAEEASEDRDRCARLADRAARSAWGPDRKCAVEMLEFDVDPVGRP